MISNEMRCVQRAIALIITLVASVVVSTMGVAQAGTLKVMFTGRANNPTLSKLIKEYQKNHHSTRIEPVYMEWRDQAEAIGKKPDVYVGDRWFLSDNIDISLFEDLSKLLPAASLRGIHKELLYSCTLGKRIYGVPLLGYCNLMVYNAVHFKQIGLAVPSSSWTWQGKFYEALRKLSRDTNGDGVFDRFGCVGVPGADMSSLLYSFGGSYVDRSFKKVLYTEKPAMDAINFILKLHQEKLMEPVDYSEVNNEDPKTYPFYNGKSSMDISWGSSFSTEGWSSWMKKNGIVNLEPAYSVVPSGPKGAIPSVDCNVAAIMVTCKNKKEAAEFVRYVIDIKGQKMLYEVTKGLPTTDAGLSIAAVKKDLPAPFLRAYRFGRGRYLRRQVYQVESTLWNDLAGIARGEVTMKDLLDNAKSRATEILDSISY